MRVTSDVLECIHLDPGYALLTVQNVITCMELFRLMDIHRNGRLNDVQFWVFIREFTDLTKYEGDLLFKLLDVDHSGEMDFEEFYLVFCILVACKDQYEKEFIYRHSKSIFRLIDSDASGLINHDEFSRMGVLFNFDHHSISAIFKEFDISGDKNLDFGEFRLFTMACIDEQRAVDAKAKIIALRNYHHRLLVSLQPVLKKYIVTKVLPRPAQVEFLVDRVRNPYITRRKKWRSWWDVKFFVYVITSIYHFFQRIFRKIIAGAKSFFYKSKKVVKRCCKLNCKKCFPCCIRKTTRSKFKKRKVNHESYRDYHRRAKKTRGLFSRKKKNLVHYVPSDAYLPLTPKEENAESENVDKDEIVVDGDVRKSGLATRKQNKSLEEGKPIKSRKEKVLNKRDKEKNQDNSSVNLPAVEGNTTKGKESKNPNAQKGKK